MKRTALIKSIIIVSTITSCQQHKNQPAVYSPTLPPASNYQLVATDTIHFKLAEETFGDIDSWNVRQVDTQTIIAFYDRFSLTISEYSYPSLQRINIIDLSRYFKPTEIKSAAIKDYQNIYLTTRTKLIVTDTTGKIKNQFDFGTPKKWKMATIVPDNPLTIQNNKLFVSLYPGVDRTSKLALQKWEIIWSADLETKITDAHYHFSDMYFRNFYIAPFLRYSYCVNDSGRFVISFAGDSMLYETDLDKYHHAWSAKSRYEKKSLETVPKNKKIDVKEEWKIRMTNVSYGSIYYDKINKRYLRLIKPAASEKEIDAKDFKIPYRVIILDKDFNIIGESDLPQSVYFKKSLLTPDGHIYSQIKSKLGDEITFLRFEYRENHLTTASK